MCTISSFCLAFAFACVFAVSQRHEAHVIEIKKTNSLYLGADIGYDVVVLGVSKQSSNGLVTHTSIRVTLPPAQ